MCRNHWEHFQHYSAGWKSKGTNLHEIVFQLTYRPFIIWFDVPDSRHFLVWITSVFPYLQKICIPSDFTCCVSIIIYEKAFRVLMFVNLRQMWKIRYFFIFYQKVWFSTYGTRWIRAANLVHIYWTILQRMPLHLQLQRSKIFPTPDSYSLCNCV